MDLIHSFATGTPGSETDALAGVLMAAGMLIAIMVLFRMHRRHSQASRARNADSPRQRIDAIQDRASQRAQIDSFLADAEELTRRLAATLDQKAARIEQLIAEADDKIATLEQRRFESAPSDPLQEQIYALADEGASPLDIARDLNQQIGKVELILALRATSR